MTPNSFIKRGMVGINKNSAEYYITEKSCFQSILEVRKKKAIMQNIVRERENWKHIYRNFISDYPGLGGL